MHTGEPGRSADDSFAAANAAALRARVRELEVEAGLMARELEHVSQLAERQAQQLQCAPEPLAPVLCEVIGQPIKRPTNLIGEPIKGRVK